MANEQLRQFMVERLLDLDPTLDETQGSLMYTKVIDPLLTRLGVDPLSVDVGAFIEARLKEQYPLLDVTSPGSAVRDLFVNPLIMILEPLQREIQFLKTQNSVRDYDALAEVELDALLSNVFAYRSTGAYSRVTVRVYVQSARVISVDSSVVFSTDANVQFIPEEATRFTPADLIRSGATYYVDIPCRSIEATVDANVTRGQIRRVTGIDNVLRVTNLKDATGGRTKEDNSTFYARAERSLSERSLNTTRGIEKAIKDNFAGILSISVVGFGEPEMQRDVLQARVTISSDSSPGPLLYATARWYTHPIANTHDDTPLPFTNVVVVTPMGAVFDTETLDSIRAAHFLRVSDGSEERWQEVVPAAASTTYVPTLVSRIRRIVDMQEVGPVPNVTAVYIKVDDFELYPTPVSLDDTVDAADAGTIDPTEYLGFNKYAPQGSSAKLYREESGVDYVVGAPLPFDNYVRTATVMSFPNAVEVGKDFLCVFTSTNTGIQDPPVVVGPPDEDSFPVPQRLYTYPLTFKHSSTELGLGRLDSFLTNAQAAAFDSTTGEVVYSEDHSTHMIAKGTQVVAFGAPSYDVVTPARYDGATTPSYGLHAGVAFRVLGAPPHPMEVELILKGNTTTWASLGAAAGKYISVALYDSTFDGRVTDTATNLVWHGWGKISSVGTLSACRLRVEGVNFIRLATSALPEFDVASLHTGVYTVGNEPVVESPVSDGVATAFTLTLANTPVYPGSVISINNGVFVASDDGNGNIVGAAPVTGGTINYDTGDVLITFSAPPAAGVPWLAVYDYMDSAYTMAWTLYDGATSCVTPNGSVHTSYDELQGVPAYRAPVAGGGVVTPVQVRSFSEYLGTSWQPKDASEQTTGYQWGVGWGAGSAAFDRLLWIRLSEDFSALLSSIGESPATRCLTYLPADLDGDDTGTLTADDLKYTPMRFEAPAPTADIDADGVSESYIFQPVALPYLEGARKTTWGSGVPIYAVTDGANPLTLDNRMSYMNTKGDLGFLLPHPMGFGSLGQPPISVIGVTNVYNDHLLPAHQLLELYDEAATTPEGDVGIVVSGTPGSTPFPGAFGGEFAVANDEVHLGGLTDVYVMPETSETGSSGALTLSPDNPTVSAAPPRSPSTADPVEDVLLFAADGEINSAVDRSVFFSPSLAALYGPGLVPDVWVSVELMDPPPSFQPTTFRVLPGTYSGGMVVDAEFPLGAAHTGLTFRVYKSCTTCVTTPVITHQQGATLECVNGNLYVDVPTGFTFLEDPSTTTLYLAIDSTTAQGEYRVTGKSTTRLQLATAVTGTGSGLSYRIYEKQVGPAVATPLVRVSDVCLADVGSSSTGVRVPYRHPVDIISSDFAGYNNDPWTDENLCSCYLTPSYTGSKAALTGTVDFVVEGVVVGDVLRLNDFDEPNKYWYVSSFATVSSSNDTLVLDHDYTGYALGSVLTNVNYTLGHPAVGTATMVFKDPTVFAAISVGVGSLATTAFSYVDDAGATVKFRPSPAESFVMYSASDNSDGYCPYSDFTSGTVGGKFYLNSTTVNLLKSALVPAGEITVLSKVLKSTAFSSAEYAAGLAIAGKSVVLSIDDTRYSVAFVGTNPISFGEVTAAFNRQLGSLVNVTCEETSPSNYQFIVYSPHAVEFLTTGSVGILGTLRITDLSNTQISGSSAYFGQFTANSIEYTGSNTSRVEVTWAPPPPDGEVFFIELRSSGAQILYPADFTQRDDGLYEAAITLTSYDPNVGSGLIADETQLTASNYYSLGYDLLVDNTSYSYSAGEKCSISVTPYIVSAYATGVSSVYVLPGAQVVLDYEVSPVIATLQDFMLNKYERVVNNNPLVRHFLPAYPTMAVSYSGVPSKEQVLGYLEEYFKSLYPNKPLSVFALTTRLGTFGVTSMEFPQEAAYLTYDQSRRAYLIRSKNVVALGKQYHIMGDCSGIAVNKA